MTMLVQLQGSVRFLVRVVLPPRVQVSVRDWGLPAIVWVLRFGCWVLPQRLGNFLQKLSMSVQNLSDSQMFLFLVKRDTSFRGSRLVAEKQTNDIVVRTFVTTSDNVQMFGSYQQSRRVLSSSS